MHSADLKENKWYPVVIEINFRTGKSRGLKKRRSDVSKKRARSRANKQVVILFSLDTKTVFFAPSLTLRKQQSHAILPITEVLQPT